MAKDLALETRVVLILVRVRDRRRIWQGIPGIERSQGGRLWAAWYSGGETEGPDNYVLVVTSSDDGKSWSEPLLVIDPRAMSVPLILACGMILQAGCGSLGTERWLV